MTKRAISLAGVALVTGAAVLSAACGGSGSAKVAPSSTVGASAVANNGTPGARGGFGNRTPRADAQTAIAEGTPASALRGPGGGPGGFGGGGRRTVDAIATLLGVDPAALQTELQATGATIASVAAAHGKDRATVRQALIEAQRQRIADAVANGSVVQADADAMAAQFEMRVDTLLDSNGAGPGGNPGGDAPPPAP